MTTLSLIWLLGLGLSLAPAMLGKLSKLEVKLNFLHSILSTLHDPVAM
jgi:hypothetical protein